MVLVRPRRSTSNTCGKMCASRANKKETRCARVHVCVIAIAFLFALRYITHQHNAHIHARTRARTHMYNKYTILNALNDGASRRKRTRTSKQQIHITRHTHTHARRERSGKKNVIICISKIAVIILRLLLCFVIPFGGAAFRPEDRISPRYTLGEKSVARRHFVRPANFSSCEIHFYLVNIVCLWLHCFGWHCMDSKQMKI